MKLLLVSSLFILLFLFACNQENPNNESQKETTEQVKEPFFKLTLAQWSLHIPIQSGEMDPMDFAKVADEMGFDGIEYVSGLYKPLFENEEDPNQALQNILIQLKENSVKYGMENVLIMVDGEGNLASESVEERDKAVENHKKWVDAAQFLGAQAIRVNLFGAQEPEEWKTASIDGLSKLADYGQTKGINILVENHGGLSSDAKLLMEVMNGVNASNCGTLPDFGNFCLKREGGHHWEGKCIEEYNRYTGIKEMMPKALAVSAKSYNFDENGNETTIDYQKMLQIIKNSGYKGTIDVEYDGEDIPAKEGIMLTKNLLLKSANHLN